MERACVPPSPACGGVGEPSAREPSARRSGGLLAALSLSFACVALDNSKLVLAVPTLARELGADSPAGAAALSARALGADSPAGAAALRWTVEANLIVYASLLLLGGALSERFGARRLLFAGLGLFALGSALSAAASSLVGLCAARALIGLGAALLVPASLAALEHAFGADGRARAVSIWTASFGAAAALGPVLGGFLLVRWGWRASLLGSLPFALLAIAAVRELVPDAQPRREAPIDLLGAALGFGATLCVLVALLGGAPPGLQALALASGAGGYALLALWQRRARHPMLEPQLFRLPAVRGTLLVILLAYLAFSGLGFAVVQHLQRVREHTPAIASLLNLPLPLALLGGTLLAPRLMARAGAERALAVGLGAALGGALSIGVACAVENDLVLCLALVPFAAGAGSAFANATGRVLGAAPAERAGSAAAVSESAFELGGVLGIALLGTRLGSLPGPRGASWAALGAALALALALFVSRSARAR